MPKFPNNTAQASIDLWRENMAQMQTDQIHCYTNILALVLGAHGRLTVQEMTDILELIPGRAATVITKLCKLLLQLVGEGLQLSHASVRDLVFEFLLESACKAIDLRTLTRTPLSRRDL